MNGRRGRAPSPSTFPFPLPFPSNADSAEMKPVLDHERLDVYQAAIAFVGLATQIMGALPTGWTHIADQLHRAATSIPLNIAEGTGEFGKKEKARFYRMALRSATECAAILDVLNVAGLAEAERLNAGRGLLIRIVSMLTRMVRTTVERDRDGERDRERDRERERSRGRGRGTGAGGDGQ